MIAPRLKRGDTIGIASPSHVATREGYASIVAAIEERGFLVKTASHLYANDWGYAASDKNRAADLNELVEDENVKMIFFGGGDGAVDVLPLLDYEAAAKNPKIWMSYSDGTSILNAIWSKTGLVTYYGQMPGVMPDISAYDWAQFESHLIGAGVAEHAPAQPWTTLYPGEAEGTLMGGYLDNFLFLVHTGWFEQGKRRKYILFLEDHERFSGIEHESALLSCLEQSAVMRHTAGLLFGHYSLNVQPYLLERLERVGRKWNIPVAYCDDFGHGPNHAILPIGMQARLNTEKQRLIYLGAE